MFNLALLVAMENCADGIVDIEIMSNSLYAKAVSFDEAIEPYHDPSVFYTNFAQYAIVRALSIDPDNPFAQALMGLKDKT